VVFVGSVAVVFKIVPEEAGALPAILEEIKKIVPSIQKTSEEDIGFGIKALMVTIVMPDGPDAFGFEEKLNTLPGVSRAELISADRIGV